MKLLKIPHNTTGQIRCTDPPESSRPLLPQKRNAGAFGSSARSGQTAAREERTSSRTHTC